PGCLVPNVLGHALRGARREIVAADCRVGQLSYAFSRARKKGHVLSQQPRARARRRSGARVNLVVSKGRRQRS
ncbi:MAG: PASTA domain-containing protein, partial [Gaiellaceae bacterium]